MTIRRTAFLLIALAACSHPSVAPARAPESLPEIEGWRISDGPTKYTPESLFEYIDGGADAFLKFDFQELVSTAYASARKTEVTVDVYRHSDPDRAFGMYALERPEGTTPILVGIEGYAGIDYLQFVVGPYYVKVTERGGKEAAVVRAFADRAAAGLPGTREPPAILKSFPSRGRIPRAEKLAARAFLGHAFLHDAVAIPYEIDGARLRLFVVQGRDDADVRDMVQRYRALGGSPSADAEPAGTATVNDPLNGEVTLKWRGRWLWGAVDHSGPRERALVEELGRGLP